jgi:hypothetical protein
MEADDRLHVVRQTLDGSARRPGVAGHRGLEVRQVGQVIPEGAGSVKSFRRFFLGQPGLLLA